MQHLLDKSTLYATNDSSKNFMIHSVLPKIRGSLEKFFSIEAPRFFIVVNSMNCNAFGSVATGDVAWTFYCSHAHFHAYVLFHFRVRHKIGYSFRNSFTV